MVDDIDDEPSEPAEIESRFECILIPMTSVVSEDASDEALALVTYDVNFQQENIENLRKKFGRIRRKLCQKTREREREKKKEI